MMSEAAFFNLGCEITLSDPQGSVAVANRMHMELFGVSPFVCSIIWNKLLAGHHILSLNISCVRCFFLKVILRKRCATL